MEISARELLSDLEGRTIRTLSGRRNRVIRVSGDHVIVATDRSPEGKPVPLNEVQDALDRLYREGTVEISVDEVGYRSGFIAALLGTLPNVEASRSPRRITLRKRRND